MMDKPSNTANGYVVGVLSGATWGLDTVVLGIAMAMSPFVENKMLVAGGAILVSALHDVFSACWLLAYMSKNGRIRELLPALKTRDGRYCVLSSVFGGPLAMTFYTLAIASGGAALTANVTAIYPLLGTVLAVWILKERTVVQTWVGLILCVVGICVMGHMPSDGAQVNVLAGIAFALVAAVGWATEGVVCGYGMKNGRVDPILALLIREITSGLVYIAVVAPVFLNGFANVVDGVAAVFSNWFCGTLIVGAALVGMFSFGFWYTAIDKIGAARGLCLNVTYSAWAVVFTVLLSFVFPEYLSRTVSVCIVIGSVLMIGGVALATLSRSKGDEAVVASRCDAQRQNDLEGD